MRTRISLLWRVYDAAVLAGGSLHYGLLSRFSDSRLNWLRSRLRPRLPAPAATPRIWIHAAARGEAKIAEALRARLLELDPSLSVVHSTTLPEGLNHLTKVAGADSTFAMPLDTLPEQMRLIQEVRPDVSVLVESEFWPAQFAAARLAEIPVVVVNAILSERTFARHRRFPAFPRATVLNAARVYAESEAISQRFRQLGYPDNRLRVCGSLKLVPPTPRPVPDRSGPQTIAFGNIHAAELEPLRDTIVGLRSSNPELRIVLVPRHPTNFPLAPLGGLLGSDLALADGLSVLSSDRSFICISAMGVLTEVYRRSDIAVVCGTFDDTGGHDLVEPLHYGALSVYGPRVERQLALHRLLEEQGCGVQVGDPAALGAGLARLLRRPEEIRAMVSRFAGVSAAAEHGLEAIAADIAAMARERLTRRRLPRG